MIKKPLSLREVLRRLCPTKPHAKSEAIPFICHSRAVPFRSFERRREGGEELNSVIPAQWLTLSFSPGKERCPEGTERSKQLPTTPNGSTIFPVEPIRNNLINPRSLPIYRRFVARRFIGILIVC